MERIKFFDSCSNLAELKTKETKETLRETSQKRRYCHIRRQSVNKAKVILKTKKTKVVGNSRTFKRMLDYARSFCSYINYGERGKLTRRAIASPNVVLRMHLHIIEEFHLKLSKDKKGSTIAIEG